MSLISVARLRRVVLDVSPLRARNFRLLWSSTVVVAVGSQVTAVAVPKQLYDDTGSSTWVGISGLVALVPLVVFALWGGAIADAMDRRLLLLLSGAGVFVTTALLWLQSFLGLHSIAVVLALLAVQQACVGIDEPTRGSIVPRLVEERQLPAANALEATVLHLGAVLGPLLAGVLIPVVGVGNLYLIDTVAQALSVLAVVRLPALPPSVTEGARAGLSEIISGFRYLAGRSVLLVSYLADIIAMVFGMPRALFPEMAQRTFAGAGSGLALGVLYAAIPVGAVLGGLFSGMLSRIRRQGIGVIAGVCVWGASVGVFGMCSSLWIGAVFLALAGAGDLFSMVLRTSILQAAATDEMRGRMQGVFIVVVAGGPRLADLLHGTVGAAIGTRATVTAGGFLVVLLVGVLALAAPGFTRYRAG